MEALQDLIVATNSYDDSIFVATMLGDLINNVAFAVLLVMIVVVAILGLRSALLVAISIPGSYMIGFIALNMMGLSANIVVLFSLILASGMLVDGAVVGGLGRCVAVRGVVWWILERRGAKFVRGFLVKDLGGRAGKGA